MLCTVKAELCKLCTTIVSKLNFPYLPLVGQTGCRASDFTAVVLLMLPRQLFLLNSVESAAMFTLFRESKSSNVPDT